MNGVEILLAVGKQDSDQIDHQIGPFDRRGNRGVIAHIGMNRRNLADIAGGFQKQCPVRTAHRHAHIDARPGQFPHHIATDKAGPAKDRGLLNAHPVLLADYIHSFTGISSAKWLTATTSMEYPPVHPVPAQVAELVDALASGASDRKVVEVRVFSWAPSGFSG